MDLSVLSSNPVILVCGALLVVIVAWYIFRSNANSSQKTVTNEKEETGPVKKIDELPEKTKNIEKKKSFGLLQVKEVVLKKFRSFKKAENPKNDTMKTMSKKIKDNENFTEKDIPVPVVENTVSMVTDDNSSHDELALKNAAIPVEEVYQTESVQDVDANIVPQAIQPVEKIEEPEAPPKSGKSGSDIFSMFTDEGGEESEASKFAANLSPITIGELMKDIEDLKKHLRR